MRLLWATHTKPGRAVLTGLGTHLGGAWKAMARNLPYTVKESSPNGLVSNWTQWCPSNGFMPDKNKGPYGSYGAIRAYMWAGMTDPATPGAHAVLDHMLGMALFLRNHKYPPTTTNVISRAGQGQGPVGFSAALLPYLRALGATHRFQAQELLMKDGRQPDGLYGKPTRYYDQNLALFALGFLDYAFHFSSKGNLEVSWQ